MREEPHTVDVLARAEQCLSLSNHIRKMLDGGSYSDHERVQYAVGALHLSLEHHRAVAIAVINDLPWSATALYRPQFEAYVTAMWLLKCASDDIFSRFKSGKYNPKLDKMISAIALHPELKGTPLKAYKAGSGSAMDAWTHGGIEILAKLADDPFAVDLLHTHRLLVKADSAALFVGMLLADILSNKAARNVLNKIADDLRAEISAVGI